MSYKLDFQGLYNILNLRDRKKINSFRSIFYFNKNSALFFPQKLACFMLFEPFSLFYTKVICSRFAIHFEMRPSGNPCFDNLLRAY